LRSARSRAGATLLALALAQTASRGDEIFFKNGDRLTGKIVTAQEGTMTIQSNVAGEIKVKMTDIESFKTIDNVDVRLHGGAGVSAKVVDANEADAVIIAPDTPAARTVKVENIRAINPKEGWNGSLTAGALVTRGNTFSDNFNVNVDAERRTAVDRVTAGATYLYGRQKQPGTGEKETTTDNWNVRGKYDYFFNTRLYAYTNARVESDEIARLDLRVTPGIGLGYQWIERPKLKISTEAGVTYVYERFDPPDTPDDGFRDHNESLSGRLAYKLESRINDRFVLFHNTEYLPSFQESDDYLITSDAGMRVTLTGRLFMEYKLTLTFDAQPAPGATETDLRHLISVGWQF
jgi:putative salt-induced outer membrane protein YdiY